MSRRNTEIGIDMFPFLSVLCSVIGVLMLFKLLIIATRLIDAEESTARVQAHSGGESTDNTGIAEDDLKTLQSSVQELSKQLHEQQKELTDLLNMRNELQVLLATKLDEIELVGGGGTLQGANISPEQYVEMVPVGDTDIVKTPRFVEVHLQGYVLHPEGTQFSINELPETTQAISHKDVPASPMERFLDQRFETRDRDYLVLLIRPSGAVAFKRLKRYLIRKYPHPGNPRELSEIDIGWEPFADKWVLQSKQLAKTNGGNE